MPLEYPQSFENEILLVPSSPISDPIVTDYQNGKRDNVLIVEREEVTFTGKYKFLTFFH